MTVPTSAVRSLSWKDTSAQLCSGCRNRTLACTCAYPHAGAEVSSALQVPISELHGHHVSHCRFGYRSSDKTVFAFRDSLRSAQQRDSAKELQRALHAAWGVNMKSKTEQRK